MQSAKDFINSDYWLERLKPFLVSGASLENLRTAKEEDLVKLRDKSNTYQGILDEVQADVSEED